MKFRDATSQFITHHSAIGGPCRPELEVRVILVSLMHGRWMRWSRPAETVWMSFILKSLDCGSLAWSDELHT